MSVQARSSRQEELDKIVSELSQEMAMQYGMVYEGHGHTLYEGAKDLAVNFSLCKTVDLDEARVLEIKATERFIELLNNSSKMRSYLPRYPVSVIFAGVTITFKQAEKGCYQKDGVAYVFTAKSNVYFRKALEGNNQLVPLKEEPYKEAMSIVNTPSTRP